MRRNHLITLLAVIFLLYGIVFTINKYANAASTPIITPDAQTIEKATAEFMANICAGHGGVNCSIVNTNASVVCKDGTIDASFPTIYGVPQCQQAIQAFVTQQSDFMAESGCFPPSELRCVSESSYQKLSNQLLKSGLVSSELGKGELAECRRQIGEYREEMINYKQCLVDNGESDFELSGKFILPILKTMFCPLFYGQRASYDNETELCRCDSGYFMNQEQCVQADQICQAKYGPRASAKNGSCSVSSTTSTFIKSLTTSGTVPPKSSPRLQETTLTLPRPTTSYPPRINISPTVYPSVQNEIKNNFTEESGKDFVATFFSSILSGVKKMLNLF